MKKIVEVAAAVILRSDGAFLLGRRPSGSFYAGYWEFPGGKIESGETPYDALLRELHEELGIRVTRATPWIVREFVYEHAHVRLHFFRVLAWTGELCDLQHDALVWQAPDNVEVAPLLPANAPVLAALNLPDFYAITHAGEIGIEAQLGALRAALERGLRLVQIREPALPPEPFLAFIQAAVDICHRHGACVLVNGDFELARQSGADGVHLTAARLMKQESRPDFPLVAASCHDAMELNQAARLGLDFVVLGPIKETASHPGVLGIGWDCLAKMLENYPLPVFALGGLNQEDLQKACQAGAQGIAAIRAAWYQP